VHEINDGTLSGELAMEELSSVHLFGDVTKRAFLPLAVMTGLITNNLHVANFSEITLKKKSDKSKKDSREYVQFLEDRKCKDYKAKQSLLKALANKLQSPGNMRKAENALCKAFRKVQTYDVFFPRQTLYLIAYCASSRRTLLYSKGPKEAGWKPKVFPHWVSS